MADTIVTTYGTEGDAPTTVTLSRPIPDGPTISIPVTQELTDTVRQDAGQAPVTLKRTVGNILKSDQF